MHSKVKQDEIKSYAIKLAVGNGLMTYKMSSLPKIYSDIRKSVKHYPDISDAEIAIELTKIMFDRIKMGW